VIAPFLFNTTIGALIALPAVIPIVALGVPMDIMSPRTGIGLRCLALPIIGVIYLGAVGSCFWLDVLYGVLIVTALPRLLLMILSA
jgi:hypothetical protein